MLVPWYAMAKPGYLSFYVEPDLIRELDGLAASKGYRRSEFARKCLRAGLRLAPDFPTRPTDHEVTAQPVAVPA